MNRLATLILLVIAFAFGAAGKTPYVVVLGIGQDAGVPQMGCSTPFCERAWHDQELRRSVASIALVDPDSGQRWIFDATPDLPTQFQRLKAITGDPTNSLSGIFLTHAHIGHYTGLMYLGRESMNTKGVKVWAMPRMKNFLEKNGPWSQLVSLGNISLMPLADGRVETVEEGMTVTPYIVPHRDEYSETVGFRIRTGNKSVLFIPDIDKWQKWSYGLAKAVRENDYLLVDGTFYEDGEIARPISEVPHPFVTETMSLLKDLPQAERSKVWFIHFNHTNPLAQSSRKELAEVAALGFGVATEGKIFELGGSGKR